MELRNIDETVTGSGQQPLISVLVPVYNAGDRLTACINSILAQSWHNLELILVDDAATGCVTPLPARTAA